MKSSSRGKGVLARVVLVIVSVAVGAFIAEVALRLAGYSDPIFYTLDQTRGYALQPNAEGWYRKEGEAYVRINGDGLRDAERPIAKPDGTFRIAVLGDSYPEAFQVSMEDAFWSVMTAKLTECNAIPGKKIDVLNFGVSGYGTAQELLTLREQVWKYAPDLVILTVTTNNDVTDNSRVLKKTDEVPYFTYQNNQLNLDDSFKTSRSFLLRQSRISRFGRWVRSHSRVVQAVVEGHRSFKSVLASWRRKSEPVQSTHNEKRENAELFSRSEELGIDNLVYLEPVDQAWNDAWRVTEALIVQMRDEVKARGSGFMVVTLSNGPQVLPDPTWREAFQTRMNIRDLFYPDHRIESLAQREQIPAVMLAPGLQQFAENNKVFLHGFGKDAGNGHWNATGHRAAGELLAKKICQGAFLK